MKFTLSSGPPFSTALHAYETEHREAPYFLQAVVHDPDHEKERPMAPQRPYCGIQQGFPTLPPKLCIPSRARRDSGPFEQGTWHRLTATQANTKHDIHRGNTPLLRHVALDLIGALRGGVPGNTTLIRERYDMAENLKTYCTVIPQLRNLIQFAVTSEHKRI